MERIVSYAIIKNDHHPQYHLRDVIQDRHHRPPWLHSASGGHCVVRNRIPHHRTEKMFQHSLHHGTTILPVEFLRKNRGGIYHSERFTTCVGQRHLNFVPVRSGITFPAIKPYSPPSADSCLPQAWLVRIKTKDV